ncbi:MAG TPA: MBL fold metallo-hydrolase [Chloroflexota bacterium]|nr:MBL fold metallo-hydrolase [Chloroflexota bacterium]
MTDRIMDRQRCLFSTGTTRTRYGEVPAFEEGLYQVGERIYAWMVPNGSWGETNAGLIVGDGEALLVDTFWDARCTQIMLDAMSSVLAGTRITHVVNTHADGDHFWGNSVVDSAEIVTSGAARAEMRSMRPGALVSLGKIGRVLSGVRVFGADKVGHWFQAMVAPYDFRSVVVTPASREFVGETTLSIGGRTVRLVEVGPAHTAGDTLVYVPDAKVLFSGDIVFAGSTPVMWSGPIDNWLIALERILALDFDLVIPGHGFITDKRGVEQVRDYWEFLQTEIRTRYDAGMKAGEAARDIALSSDFARRPFAQWNSPERIVVSTHTEYRHLDGKGIHLGSLAMLNLMRQQALLAFEFPEAQPASMRKLS